MDAATLVSRLAVSIANQFSAYAMPASPEASSPGGLDSTGPLGVAVRAVAGHADQLLVAIVGTAIQKLSTAAQAGAGWQARGGTQVFYGRAATLVDGGRFLLVSFTGVLPQNGSCSLFYGYGPGRIYAQSADPALQGAEAAGQGSAVYDAAGMPLSVTPVGLIVASPASEQAPAPATTMIVTEAGSVTIAAAAASDLVFSHSASLVFLGGTGVHTVVGTAGTLLVDGQAGRVQGWGSSGATTLFGGAIGGNVMSGGSGQATIVGAFDDELCGGSGTAVIFAGGGENTLFGASGAAGAVTMVGGAGDDEYVSGQGATVVFAGSGRDTAWGSGDAQSSAQIFGGSGPDVLVAGRGNDVIYGGSGAETLIGGSGAGLIHGGTGRSVVFMGAGNTAYSAGGAGSASTVVGGAASSAVVFDGGDGLAFAGSGSTAFDTGSGAAEIVMDAQSRAHNTVRFGSGAATVWNAGACNAFLLVNGSAGGTDLISGFRPSFDRLALQGYSASAVGDAVAGQTASAGGTVLHLGDGSSITLLGVNQVDARMFA